MKMASIILFLSLSLQGFCDDFHDCLIGSVWTGQITIKGNNSNEIINKKVSLTFINDTVVQYLEWQKVTSELTDVPEYYRYDYKTIDNDIIFSKSNIEYYATVSGNELIIPKWTNDESLYLYKRDDLSSNDNRLKITNIEYRNGKFIFTIECKLLSNYTADIQLYFTNEKNQSIGIGNLPEGTTTVQKGYNMITNAYTEKDIQRIETDLISPTIKPGPLPYVYAAMDDRYGHRTITKIGVRNYKIVKAELN